MGAQQHLTPEFLEEVEMDLRQFGSAAARPHTRQLLDEIKLLQGENVVLRNMKCAHKIGREPEASQPLTSGD